MVQSAHATSYLQFFDKEQVVDPASKKSLEVFQKMKVQHRAALLVLFMCVWLTIDLASQIQCCGSGRGRLVIGETHGMATQSHDIVRKTLPIADVHSHHTTQ